MQLAPQEEEIMPMQKKLRFNAILAKVSKMMLLGVKVITEKIEFILYRHQLSFFQQQQHLFKQLNNVGNANG